MSDILNPDDFNRTLASPILPGCCLLCRQVPDDAEKTEEHIFPKWVQRKFDLWNEELHLINGSTIPYRQLTVVACRRCNNDFLNPLEIMVSNAVESGYEAVSKLPRFVLAQWLAKLYLGIRQKECSLNIDRRDPALGPIFTPELLKHLDLMSYWLNTCRIPIREGPPPSSVIVCRAKVPKSVKDQFDFKDMTALFGRRTIAATIRMADSAIFIHFMDYNSHNEQLGDAFVKQLPAALHPFQFNELSAQWLYKASLMRLNVQAERLLVGEDFVFHQFSRKSTHPDGCLYADWNQEEYARLLSAMTGLPLETVTVKDGMWTCLLDENSQPRDMPLVED
jgi:hypothetical protein